MKLFFVVAMLISFTNLTTFGWNVAHLGQRDTSSAMGDCAEPTTKDECLKMCCSVGCYEYIFSVDYNQCFCGIKPENVTLLYGMVCKAAYVCNNLAESKCVMTPSQEMMNNQDPNCWQSRGDGGVQC